MNDIETFLEWKEINDNKYKVLSKYERLVGIILELKDIISYMPSSPILHIKDIIEEAEKIIKE